MVSPVLEEKGRLHCCWDSTGVPGAHVGGSIDPKCTCPRVWRKLIRMNHIKAKGLSFSLPLYLFYYSSRMFYFSHFGSPILCFVCQVIVYNISCGFYNLNKCNTQLICLEMVSHAQVRGSVPGDDSYSNADNK